MYNPDDRIPCATCGKPMKKEWKGGLSHDGIGSECDDCLNRCAERVKARKNQISKSKQLFLSSKSQLKKIKLQNKPRNKNSI